MTIFIFLCLSMRAKWFEIGPQNGTTATPLTVSSTLHCAGTIFLILRSIRMLQMDLDQVTH